MREWNKFDTEEVESVHGKVYFYRDLYEGKHSQIFDRARNLIEKGDITDNIIHGHQKAVNVQTPYVISNLSKVIAEIPATLVSRSIGDIRSSIEDNEPEESEEPEDELDENNTTENEETPFNEEYYGLQQEAIDELLENSHLEFSHWGNVVQQQVDGGIVGVPWLDESGLRIDFKARDVYFPHDDGKGADLVYNIEIEGDKYLHVYREAILEGGLVTRHLLYHLDASNKTKLLDEQETKELLGISELEKQFKGRKQSFIIYWANEKTFMNPLGVSALQNQGGKQDEINWTLTRNALTFERNGKPRIAVSKEIMQALQEKAQERYGDSGKIDHRDLEITTFDEQGKAMEVIQMDVDKIGDIQWVKDLMKMMFMETSTSEKAIDFYMDEGGGSTGESGVAKFYDLFTSLTKAERLRDEYMYFIKHLIKSALWLKNYFDSDVEIEEPEIDIKAMIPISRKDLLEQNGEAYEGGIQSLETTVRRTNPEASEEWIAEELDRIESSSSTDDSFSLANGRQTLQDMFGNKNPEGEPLDNQGNPVKGDEN